MPARDAKVSPKCDLSGHFSFGSRKFPPEGLFCGENRGLAMHSGHKLSNICAIGLYAKNNSKYKRLCTN